MAWAVADKWSSFAEHAAIALIAQSAITVGKLVRDVGNDPAFVSAWRSVTMRPPAEDTFTATCEGGSKITGREIKANSE